MSKRHSKTKEILAEMSKWAKKKEWPVCPPIYHGLHFSGIGCGCVWEMMLDKLCDSDDEKEAFCEDVDSFGFAIHFIPRGCSQSTSLGEKFAYCARPGVGKVVKHKIGNCPLSKEEKP